MMLDFQRKITGHFLGFFEDGDQGSLFVPVFIDDFVDPHPLIRRNLGG
jgi:hypothetical protein